MSRSLSQIIAHIRAVAADPRIDTTLIQTGDLLALCDAAEGDGAALRLELPADSIERLEAKTANLRLVEDNERLRAESLRVSCHCADLIQAMRDHGISDEAIAAIARQQPIGETFPCTYCGEPIKSIMSASICNKCSHLWTKAYQAGREFEREHGVNQQTASVTEK